MTNYDEQIYEYRWQICFLFFGLILLLGGVWYSGLDLHGATVEVIGEGEQRSIVIEVSGAVNSPGVYELPSGSRVEDAINAAGGFSADADHAAIERFINRAALVTDGQKFLIPSYQSDNDSASEYQGVQGTYYRAVNINTASASELESLKGIGPVYAQKIIDNRPYSSTEELLTKKIIKSNVYEENKDILSVY